MLSLPHIAEDRLVVARVVQSSTENMYSQRHIWPCAIALSLYLASHWRDCIAGKSIIEIGAGTCLPGTTAALLGASRVVCTDQSLSRMPALSDQNEGVLSLAAMPWADVQAIDRIASGGFDVIIGADVLFHHDVFDAVLATCSRIAQQSVPPPTIVLAFQSRSSSHSLLPLLSQWSMRVVDQVRTDQLLEDMESGLSDQLHQQWMAARDREAGWSMAGLEGVEIYVIEVGV
ncbi:hypothetical protein BC828DRAFT_403599 [Blastocladiella britannica]|nr:hypothetical protein BC828DRAFT_403599 [Blastocladiella britannica]